MLKPIQKLHFMGSLFDQTDHKCWLFDIWYYDSWIFSYNSNLGKPSIKKFVNNQMALDFLRPKTWYQPTCVAMYYKLKLRVSFTSDMIESIKTHPVLHVLAWSLGGQDGSWYHWQWCQYALICIMITVNFINFWVEKVHQDSLCPQSPTLESWRTGWFLISLTLVSIFLEMYSKHILKVSFNSDMHNTFKTHCVL